jgi:hypothetical protein
MFFLVALSAENRQGHMKLHIIGPEEEMNDYSVNFEFFDYILGIAWHILELWTAGVAD